MLNMSKQSSNSIVTTKCDYCKNFTVRSDHTRIKSIDDCEKGEPCQSNGNQSLKEFANNLIKVPKALLPQDKKQPPTGTLDPNVYTIKKSLMTLLCLIIIIMENSIQIKFVIKHGKTLFNQFYSIQLTLGITSILLSTFTGILLMYAARLNFNDHYKQRKLDFLNNIAMILLFILCIFNIFLVAMN